MRWIAGLAGVVLLGLIIYSTLQQNQYQYEVCVAFRSRAHCATAAARTPEQAIQTARQIACSLITSGRDENILCLDTRPTSVRELSRP